MTRSTVLRVVGLFALLAGGGAVLSVLVFGTAKTEGVDASARVSRATREARQARSIVDLRQVVTAPAWTGVYKIEAYARDEDMSKLIGAPWNGPSTLDLGHEGGSDTLVFLNGGRVVAYATVPGTREEDGAFTCVIADTEYAGFERAAARFGWSGASGYLLPLDGKGRPRGTPLQNGCIQNRVELAAARG